MNQPPEKTIKSKDVKKLLYLAIFVAILVLIAETGGDTPPKSVAEAEEYIVGTWKAEFEKDFYDFEFRAIFKENHDFIVYGRRTGTSKTHDWEVADKGSWEIYKGEYVDTEETYYGVDFGKSRYVITDKKRIADWGEDRYEEYNKTSDKQQF